ncbi:MAG TPA: MOP flippase family protein [Bryobacteraceae bacterium]|nr:MOP flippase family protein [Bryobacteraceae bacterium]
MPGLPPPPPRDVQTPDDPAIAPPSLTQRAVSSTSWVMLSTAARQVLTLVSASILGRLLGPSSYGLMGMAALISAFLLNFRDLGTVAAVIRGRSVSQSLLSSLFWINFFLGILLSGSMLVIAYPAAAFFHEPRVTPIMQALAVTFWIASSGLIHNAILTREMAFRKIAIADIAAAVVGYGVAIPCALAGYGVWSLVFANLLTTVVSTILYWTFTGWRPSLIISAADLKSISKFSLNLSGFGLVNYFARNADNLVVGRVLGAAELGQYQMAYNLMLYPIQMISSVLSQALFPAFAKLQDDDERFRSAYVRSCALIALVTFPVLVGLGVVADPMVRVLLGPKWLPVIPVLHILAPVGVIQSIQTTVGQIYITKGRTDWMFRWGIFSTVLVVTAFMIGVHWGILGVAAGYASVYFGVVAYWGFAIPFRLIGLKWTAFLAELLPGLASSAFMACGCLAWLYFLRMMGVSNPVVQLATTVLLGAGLYIGALLVSRARVLSHMNVALGEARAPGAAALVRLLSRFA